MRVESAHRLLLATLILAAVAYFASRGDEPAPPAAKNPMTAIPSGVTVLLSADIERMRKSKLGQQTLQALLKTSAGCSYDPTREAKRLALALPRGTTEPQLAVAGEFEPPRLLECARTQLETGEARAEAPYHTHTKRGFLTLEAGPENGALSVRGDLLLVASAEGLERMREAALLTTPNVKADKAHRLLRDMVGANGTVVGSWLIEAHPLLTKLGLESFDALGELRALAWRLDFDPELRLDAVVVCRDQRGCLHARAALTRLQQNAAEVDRLLGVPVLSQLQLTAPAPTRLELVLRLSGSQAADLVARLSDWLGAGPALTSPQPSSRP